MAFTALIFTNLQKVQQHYMDIFCNKFHPNWSRSMELMDINSFKSISKVSLSLCWCSQFHACVTTLCKEMLNVLTIVLCILRLTIECYNHIIYLMTCFTSKCLLWVFLWIDEMYLYLYQSLIISHRQKDDVVST
jgi:hypothetical protein